MSKILIIGETSFVASKTIAELKNLIVPSLDELDITNITSIRDFTSKNDFDAVVNFAAFTNVKAVTMDHSGLAWKLNVEAAGNVAKVCKETGKFLIHISTDSVFPVIKSIKGPHIETEEIDDSNPNNFSAYGYTKLMGEKEVINSQTESAILRIAYPFGNAAYQEKDYLMKLITSIKANYPLFADQQFTPTYLRTLPSVIEKISQERKSGIFHCVCRGLTTPYDIGVYVNEKLNLGLTVKKGSLAEYEKVRGPQPYAMFGGLSTEITEDKLGLKNLTWEEAIGDFLPELKSHLE